MASKNVTQVLIAGKIYRLSGYESEEYLQRVAAYLNGKITEIKTLDGYSRLTPDMKSLLLNLNTADDYFKLKKQADQLGDQISQKDRELYEIKHELITANMKLETAENTLSSLRDTHAEDQRRIAVLETQLAELRARLPEGDPSAAASDENATVKADSEAEAESTVNYAKPEEPAGEPQQMQLDMDALMRVVDYRKNK